MSSRISQLNITSVTVCCQNTDARAAVTQSVTKLQTPDYIHAHVNGPGANPPPCVGAQFFFLTVSGAMTEYMLEPAAKESW